MGLLDCCRGRQDDRYGLRIEFRLIAGRAGRFVRGWKWRGIRFALALVAGRLLFTAALLYTTGRSRSATTASGTGTLIPFTRSDTASARGSQQKSCQQTTHQLCSTPLQGHWSFHGEEFPGLSLPAQACQANVWRFLQFSFQLPSRLSARKRSQSSEVPFGPNNNCQRFSGNRCARRCTMGRCIRFST